MDDESTTKTSRLKSRTVTIIGNDYVEVSYIVLTLTCSHLKSICQKKRNERGTNFGNFLLLIIAWEEMVVVTNNPLPKYFKNVIKLGLKLYKLLRCNHFHLWEVYDS